MYRCMYVITYVRMYVLIKTHDSESRGQEEVGSMQRMSESFTDSTTLKFTNAIKPPLMLSLSYQGPACSI